MSSNDVFLKRTFASWYFQHTHIQTRINYTHKDHSRTQNRRCAYSYYRASSNWLAISREFWLELFFERISANFSNEFLFLGGRCPVNIQISAGAMCKKMFYESKQKQNFLPVWTRHRKFTERLIKFHYHFTSKKTIDGKIRFLLRKEKSICTKNWSTKNVDWWVKNTGRYINRSTNAGKIKRKKQWIK